MAKLSDELRESLGVVAPADAIKYLNLLVYGEPGVGKTVLLGTAQDHKETSPVVILDIEGGTTSLRKRQDIDVIPIRSMTELEHTYAKLREENNGYYKTVCVDSLSELQKLDIGDIMEDVYNRNPTRDKDIPGLQEWGKSSNRIRKIVRAFRDLEMNTIMTCHVDIRQDDNQVTTYGPMLPGKLKIDISGFMDIVGYMTARIEDGELVRSIQFQKTRRVIAKDRTWALDSVVEQPTIPMLWDALQKSDSDAKG